MIIELNKLVNSTKNVLIKQVERSWNDICQLTEAVSSTGNAHTKYKISHAILLCSCMRTCDIACPLFRPAVEGD